jgi:hypothetical protein
LPTFPSLLSLFFLLFFFLWSRRKPRLPKPLVVCYR